MFAWKDRRDFQEQARKLSVVESAQNGVNRRAISLVPIAQIKETHEISQSNYLRYHQLLISIEGRQSTCCLRIVSPRNKSRSAILIFRGRILGCLYGNKRFAHQLIGQDAYAQAMADLAAPDNILDAYLLSEELVLAASALFHGQVIDTAEDMTSSQIFELASQRLIQSNMPGCIVISTNDNLAVCVVYFFAGRIVGVYSYKDGWVESSYETGMRYVQTTENAKVMASMLGAKNIDEVMQLTSSLTGLADRGSREWSDVSPSQLPKPYCLLETSQRKSEGLRNTFQLNSFTPPRRQQAIGGAGATRHSRAVSHAHMISP